MSIPLVQNNEKDSINTSIIAIKRNIERINMLLGLSNSEEIDTSEFVKKSDIVDVVEAGNMNPVTSNAVVPVDEVTSGNMQSVTSNAVSKAMSYLTTEHKTGRYCDNKPTYEKYFFKNRSDFPLPTGIANLDKVVSIKTTAFVNPNYISLPYFTISSNTQYYGAIYYSTTENNCHIESNLNISTISLSIEYTKATD